MKKNNNIHEGDVFVDRLFLFLVGCGINVWRIESINRFVYKIMTHSHTWLLKGYDTHEKVKQQWSFLQALKHTGFASAPYPCRFPDGSVYHIFADYYWLLNDYIAHDEPFSFESKENRLAGIEVLTSYHHHAQHIAVTGVSYIPMCNWLQKWERRIMKFQRYIVTIASYVGNTIATELLQWSVYVFKKLQATSMTTLSHTFIHGDIITHNFIKGHRTFLIDFDCVSFGPILYDYVKYCYSILPFEEWSYDNIKKYEVFGNIQTEVAFQLGLMMPGDILREWDYFLSLPETLKQQFVEKILVFTTAHHKERMHFIETIAKELQ